MKKNLSTLIIIGILILIVIFLILVKKKREQAGRIVKIEERNSSVIDSNNVNPQDVVLSAEVLALVNNSSITKDYLNGRYEALPDQQKELHKNSKEEFLELLITRELLYQDAVKGGFDRELDDIEDIEEKKDKAIEKLLVDVSSVVNISEEEMKTFYNEHLSEMQGAPFEQVRTTIKDHLMQQMQDQIINGYIEKLKSEADILRNDEWIAEQRALKPQNPLDVAFKSGKPTVLDMGAGTCVPCKMMKPIFEELEDEYRGKTNIILLEISEYRNLAKKYQVMVIPTQIFFDKDGNEYWRHQGFLSKNEIIKKLMESGVN